MSEWVYDGKTWTTGASGQLTICRCCSEYGYHVQDSILTVVDDFEFAVRGNFEAVDCGEGARFIVLDAYMRYPDKFVDALRKNLSNQSFKISGQELFQRTIKEVSGVPFDIYEKKAIAAQKR